MQSGEMYERVTLCSKERRGEACVLRHGAYRWHAKCYAVSHVTLFRVRRFLANWIPPAQISYRPATLLDLFDELQDRKLPVEQTQYLRRFCTCFDMECDTV